MIVGGVWALLQHPDQLAEVREDPALIPGAVEEILRWHNPLHYFRRTATEDTELSGTPIAAGDKVVMYYTSANRDEKVFADSQSFDLHRNPNPQLSFGIGEHFCLGAQLARLEAKLVFTEVLRRWPHYQVLDGLQMGASTLLRETVKLPILLAP